MNEHLSSASLKSLAKGQLLGNYGTATGAYAIHILCITVATLGAYLLIDTTTIFGSILYYAASFIISLLGGVFLFGEAYLYLKLACGQPISVNDLFLGFHSDTERILRVQVVLTLISLICSIPNMLFPYFLSQAGNAYMVLLYVVLSLLFAAINIMAGLFFAQCRYLMLDFPEYTFQEVLKASCRIMKGQKGRLFYIQLSFIPLYLLGLCTCCVSYLWILPYQQAVEANFYLDLMKKK